MKEPSAIIRLGGQRGSALLIALIACMTLAMLAVGLLNTALTNNRASDEMVYWMQSLYYARSGASAVLNNLNTGGTTPTLTASQTFSDGGSFTASAVATGTNQYTITSTGTVIGFRKENVRRKIEVVVQKPDMNPFRWAAFGRDSLTSNGVTNTNSYDSTKGVFNPNNPGSKGDVGTNGTMSIGGTVHGNATLGPDATIAGASSISGNVIRLTSPVVFPDVDPGNAKTNNNNAALSDGYSASDMSFTLHGNKTVDFPAGIYYFSSFTMTGNVGIRSLGPVTIYVEGSAGIGGCADSSNNPHDTRLMVMGAESVTVHGTADIWGVVYAPNSDVTINGTPGVYGAVIGKTLSLKGTADFHFDESLANETMPGQNIFSIDSYRVME
jgi:hypothetical protein